MGKYCLLLYNVLNFLFDCDIESIWNISEIFVLHSSYNLCCCFSFLMSFLYFLFLLLDSFILFKDVFLFLSFFEGLPICPFPFNFSLFILSVFFVFKYSKVPCFLLILRCCFQVNVLWFIILWKTHKCCSTPNSFNMLGYALFLSVTITSFLNQVIIMDVWDWVLWGRCRLIDLLVNI